MRKILSLTVVAAITALSSCSVKEAIPQNVEDDAITETATVTETAISAPSFTAEISDVMTKTTLSEGSSAGLKKVSWSASDKLCVAFSTENSQSEAGYFLGTYSVAPNGDDPSTAQLCAESSTYSKNSDSPQSVVAIYPESASILHIQDVMSNLAERHESRSDSEFASDILDNVKMIGLPSTQTYDGESIGFAPMIGLANGDSTLEFYNLCALLAIKVPYSQMATVSSITVTADKYIAGIAYPQVSDTGEPSLTMESTAEKAQTLGFPLSKSVKLDCSADGNGTSIPEGGSLTFYVAIPAGEYGSLRFDVRDASSGSRMETKDGATIRVERNKIYNINFSGHPFVEIGGKVWAKINVGATTVAGSYETCYGDYFAWGETSPRYTGITFTSKSQATIDGWVTAHPDGYVSTDYPSYTGTTLDAEHDAATANWHGSWHTPSHQDFIDLLAACSDGTDASALESSTVAAGIYWVRSTQTYLPEFTGAAGFLFVAKEDPAKMLFFPAAGFVAVEGYYNNGESGPTYGSYYSSTKASDHYAYSMFFQNRSTPNNPTVNMSYADHYLF